MPNGPHNRAKIEHLAMHLATGGSVAAFSLAQDIPRRTCYAWTKEPGFVEKSAAYRATIIDRLTGSLAKLGKKAVREIGVLATGAESEAVRLQACRAILADLISVGNYSVSAKQFDDLRAQVKAIEDAIANRSTNHADE
jgi:hypothetical protein